MKKTNSVSENTQVLTFEGYKNIKEIVDKQVKVWNGVQFVTTIPKTHSPYEELLDIQFSNGCELECGLYSQFVLFNPNSSDIAHKVLAHEVSSGCKILPFDLPYITQVDDCEVPSLDNPKEPCIIGGELSIRLMYIEELIKEHGQFIVYDGDDVIQIQFPDKKDKSALLQVLYLLQTISIPSYIYSEDSFFKREDKTYVLYIHSMDIKRLIRIGLHIGYKAVNEVFNQQPIEDIYITSIKKNVKFGTTYSIFEPMRGTVVVNGILTG